jgi:hypothetical protein
MFHVQLLLTKHGVTGEVEFAEPEAAALFR